MALRRPRSQGLPPRPADLVLPHPYWCRLRHSSEVTRRRRLLAQQLIIGRAEVQPRSEPAHPDDLAALLSIVDGLVAKNFEKSEIAAHETSRERRAAAWPGSTRSNTS